MLNLADEANIKPSGYQLQNALKRLPKHLNLEENHRNNKWDGYFHYGGNTPSPDSLDEILTKYDKSAYVLTLPLWELFDEHKSAVEFCHDLLLKMPAPIKKCLFKEHSPYQLKHPITFRIINSIERMGNVYALSALLGLARLNDLEVVMFSRRVKIEKRIEGVLKICCLSPPLSRVSREVFEASLMFLHAHYKMPADDIIVKLGDEFLKHLDNLKQFYQIFFMWNITETNQNRTELLYWLLRSDEDELMADLKKIQNMQALNDKHRGVLWLLTQMTYKTRGLMSTRLTILYDKLSAHNS